MRVIRATRWLLGSVALAAGVLGAVLHVTMLDSSQLYAPIFYMLPLPVAGAALLFAALFARIRMWRRILAIGGLAVFGWWISQSYGWAFPTKAKWKVITWNMGHPRHPFEPLISLVRAERPDVIVLVESGAVPPSAVPFYEKSLPGYRMVAQSKELSCLVRGKIISSSVQGLVNGSDVAHFRVEVKGDWLEIFVADLGAFPLMPRRPQIDMLASVTRGRSRTLVMGDFNTPLESEQLEHMHASFTEAREGPYRGFRETWFYNLPLLSLDQIWCSRDLKPVFATRRLGFASDHDPVIATFNPAK